MVVVLDFDFGYDFNVLVGHAMHGLVVYYDGQPASNCYLQINYTLLGLFFTLWQWRLGLFNQNLKALMLFSLS